MPFVAVKSVEQQATMAVHTTRALLVRQRTMAANALRAALGELGIVAAQSIRGLRELMARLETANAEIPELMRARRWFWRGIGRRSMPMSARWSDRLRKPPVPIARRAG